MVKYDGPAFFRKKGVDFNNPSLNIQEDQTSKLKNEDFTPAIKRRKQVPETISQAKLSQVVDPIQPTLAKDTPEPTK
ncbi:DNA translocase FtsK, partial [Pediococcus pentosaceus]|nr:DNA translocase FtsK [Pediococcus pentosaceus]